MGDIRSGKEQQTITFVPLRMPRPLFHYIS